MVGLLGTGVCWLTLQPVLENLIETLSRSAPGAPVLNRINGVLPFFLGLDVVMLSAMTYGVLTWLVGRPLTHLEKAIEQLGRLDAEVVFRQGGPLVSRLQEAVAQMALALKTEQALTAHNVVQLKEANEKLIRAQTELVSADRLATVGKLAAGVAHEVGNPLSGILGYLSLIRSKSSGADVPDLVNRIEGEVQRIDDIVRSLLELGKPSRGKAGPLEVQSLVDSVVRMLTKGPDFGPVHVDVDIEPGLFVRGEAGQVSQILINLLLNAAQALNGKGQITVRGRVIAEMGKAYIEVHDEGPGIPFDVLPRVFEPFFTTKSAGKGTGLGLAVSLHLAHGMSGELQAGNAPTGGAQFRLTLPLP